MTKNKLRINVIFYALLIILHIVIYKNETIQNYQICTMIIIIYFFISTFNNKESLLKNVFNPFFLCLVILWMYGSFCIFQFIIDEKIPRIYFFVINENNMLLYAKAIFYIITIYSGLILLFKNKSWNCHLSDTNVNVRRFNLADIFALFITLYYFFMALIEGFFSFSLSAQDIHAQYDTDSAKYISLVMITYFVINHDSIFIFNRNRKVSYRYIFSNLIFILFWGSMAFIGRRMLFICVFTFIILKIHKLGEKFSFNSKILIAILIVLLFSIALFRNEVDSDVNIADYFYYLFGEFILVGYVTIPFLTWKRNFLYGTTYLKNVLYSFVPRKIFPDKPLSLGSQFKQMYDLNVAFAFNPVAEAFWNYSWFAVILVPILLILFVTCIKQIAKRDELFSLIFYGSIIDFCRGTMATFVFQTIILFIAYKVVFLLSKVRLKLV